MIKTIYDNLEEHQTKADAKDLEIKAKVTRNAGRIALGIKEAVGAPNGRESYWKPGSGDLVNLFQDGFANPHDAIVWNPESGSASFGFGFAVETEYSIAIYGGNVTVKETANAAHAECPELGLYMAFANGKATADDVVQEIVYKLEEAAKKGVSRKLKG